MIFSIPGCMVCSKPSFISRCMVCSILDCTVCSIPVCKVCSIRALYVFLAFAGCMVCTAYWVVWTADVISRHI